MTKAEFVAEHGAEWLKFSRKPMFTALLALIDDESPARRIHTREDNDRLHGAVVFANEIAGHERLRALLVNLGTPEAAEAEVPTTFTHPEQV
jgi:hypothetical protein